MASYKEIKKLIDYDKFMHIAKLNLSSIEAFKNFIVDFNTHLLLENDSLNNTIKRMFLISNEDFPFSILSSEEKINDEIIEDYLKILPKKTYFIYENDIIRVFSAVIENPSGIFITYKNDNNLKIEINRIFDIIDKDGKFESFLLSLDIDDIFNPDLFLNKNNTLPKILTENIIFIFSALLNYSFTEIDQTIYYKEYLKSFFKDGKIPLNWDKIRVIFKDFLKELKERTINY